MKIHYGIDNIPQIKNAVVTSGTYDGVHIGHQKILKRINEIAKDNNGESVVITFWPHPRFILNPKAANELKLLSTLDEKITLLKDSGLNHLIVIPFTNEFSQLSSQEFINKILVDKINTKKLVIGYDHKFGKNREGSFEYLKNNADKHSFTVEEIPREDIENNGVSSTKIRAALNKGEVKTAQQYLGKPYSISGKVILGEQIGRKISFPTANIYVEEKFKLIPSDGVYAVIIKLDNKEYKGMLNLGFRPTVGGLNHSIEVHIFDFKDEIYGETLSLQFIDLIRKEKKFNDIHELKNQLVNDRKNVEEVLNEI